MLLYVQPLQNFFEGEIPLQRQISNKADADHSIPTSHYATRYVPNRAFFGKYASTKMQAIPYHFEDKGVKIIHRHTFIFTKSCPKICMYQKIDLVESPLSSFFQFSENLK